MWQQHRDAATSIAGTLGRADEWDLVFQSRSGAPDVPWLEPDIGSYWDGLGLAFISGATVG